MMWGLVLIVLVVRLMAADRLAALGFSLIGVGWLYSRYLPTPNAPR